MTGPTLDRPRGPDEGPAEPTIEEIETAPPAAPITRPVAGRGRVGLRWAVALVVVALLVAATGAGAWYLAGSSGTSSLAGWAPSDSVVYAEARIDLPGDQRQQLGNVLAHFPGFKDQGILDDKIAEAFDRAIRASTNDKHDYSTDIRPWFGGELAFAVGPLPNMDPSSQSRPDVRFLVLAATKDRAATDAWVGKVEGESGTQSTTESYGGQTLRTTSKGDGRSASIAVLDRLLVAGDTASVKAAIDTHGSAGLSANQDFAAANERLTGDHLGSSYVNLRAYTDWALRLGVARGAPAGTLDPKIVDLVPTWLVSDVRATDGDAITGRTASAHTATPLIARGPSALTAHIPSSAFAVVDAHEYGTSLKAMLDLWRSVPSMSNAVKSVDQALGFLGGEDAAIGWIGETALVASRDGDGVTAGVLIAPKDRTKADALARQVRNLLALGGSAVGATTHDEDHNGTTITIVDGGDLHGLSAGGQIAGLSANGRLEVAFAIRDDLVAIGAPGFVRSALDATGTGALAANARFSAAAARVGADSPLLGWVDVTAIRDMIEGITPAGPERDRYEHDFKPYLAPFDMAAFSAVPASDVDTATFTVITK